MRISTTASFEKLRSFGEREFRNLHNMLQATNYDDEQGLGFDNISQTRNLLSARLLKRTPTTIPTFDINTGKFFDEEIFLFSEIDFRVDANLGVLEIFGPTKDSPKVRRALYPLLSPSVQIDSIQFSLSKLIFRFFERYSKVNIENLSVNNFKYADGVIGRYIIKSTETKPAIQIIEQYRQDVSRILCSITDTTFGDFTTAISNKGSLRLSCESEHFQELFEEVKGLIFSGEGE